jgi:hypothetical protein
MMGYTVVLSVFFTGSSMLGQTNGRFTFSIDGPCGETILGRPGSAYDDETGGVPYYTEWRTFPDGVRRRIYRQRRGHTWDIILTSTESPTGWGVHYWQFGLGIDGLLEIVDITTEGTAGCYVGLFPECRRRGGYDFTELTGPTEKGEEENGLVVAYSSILLKMDGLASLPPEGREPVCKIRVFAEFPEEEGEVITGRIFFTTWIAPTGVPIEPAVADGLQTEPLVTVKEGHPPLAVKDCVVSLKASSVAAFVRCDPNDDGLIDISDAVWILSELFELGAATPCRAASDCNGDDGTDIGDAVYALSYLFNGGPAPPAPFPDCSRIDVPLEDCPPGSTICP